MTRNQRANGETIKTLSPYHDIRSPFSVGEGGAYAEYVARDPDQFEYLTLGAIVAITDKDIDQTSDVWLTGRIVELQAVSPFNPHREAMLYLEDEEMDPNKPLELLAGPHTHQPMVARIRLERVMLPRNGDFVSLSVGRPPSARSRLWFPSIEQEGRGPSLRHILDIRSEGMVLGYVGQGGYPISQEASPGEKKVFLPYKWDIDNLDNKHISIIGESGSGKTVLLKNLAYELRKQNENTRIIMTDLQGDIAQMLLNDQVAFKQFAIKRGGWQTDLPNKACTLEQASNVLRPFRLVVPAIKGETHSPNLCALIELAKKANVDVKEIGLRLKDLSAPSDVEYLFRVASEQAGMLLDEEAETLQKNDAVSIPNLRSAIQNKLNETGNQLRSSGGTQYLRSTFGAAMRALKSLSEHFDYHDDSITGENPLDFLDFNGTTILYLEELNSDARMMWEMQLVKWLYDRKRENWGVFVFFDEAHQIIPAKPSSSSHAGTFDRLRDNFERLAREGRKFGINLVLSTQSPRDLHPIVPDQCPTKIVMKITSRNAEAALIDRELAPIASRFGAGEFWIQSPFNGTPEWVRVHSDAPSLLHSTMTRWWKAVVEAARNPD